MLQPYIDDMISNGAALHSGPESPVTLSKKPGTEGRCQVLLRIAACSSDPALVFCCCR